MCWPIWSATQADKAHEGPGQSSDASLDELEYRQDAAGRRLAGTLAAHGTADLGMLLVNSQSFARRSLVDVTAFGALPAVEGAVVAAQESAGRRFVVADIPGMGFCWLTAGSPALPAKKATKPIAQENVLANEFLRVEISPDTGGLQAIYDLAQRGNRLASQLAFRTPGPQAKAG